MKIAEISGLLCCVAYCLISLFVGSSGIRNVNRLAFPYIIEQSDFVVLDADLNSSALVVTVEETSIMCCSSGSFVSQGLFRNFCLRFANDFDSKAEEWIFAKEDIINTCKNFPTELP